MRQASLCPRGMLYGLCHLKRHALLPRHVWRGSGTVVALASGAVFSVCSAEETDDSSDTILRGDGRWYSLAVAAVQAFFLFYLLVRKCCNHTMHSRIELIRNRKFRRRVEKIIVKDFELKGIKVERARQHEVVSNAKQSPPKKPVRPSNNHGHKRKRRKRVQQEPVPLSAQAQTVVQEMVDSDVEPPEPSASSTGIALVTSKWAQLRSAVAASIEMRNRVIHVEPYERVPARGKRTPSSDKPVELHG